MTPQEQKYHELFQKVILEKEYLFNHGNPFVPHAEYLRHFLWRGKTLFTNFVTPWRYKIEILDQFKDRIAWATTVAVSDGNRAFMVMVQVSPDYHLNCAFAFDPQDEELSVQVEIWTRDPKDIPAFIKKNEDLRVTRQVPSAGFNHLSPLPLRS